jgi:hypothetical protein
MGFAERTANARNNELGSDPSLTVLEGKTEIETQPPRSQFSGEAVAGPQLLTMAAPEAAKTDLWQSQFATAELPSLRPATLEEISAPRIPILAWIAILIVTVFAGLLWRWQPQRKRPSPVTHASISQPSSAAVAQKNLPAGATLATKDSSSAQPISSDKGATTAPLAQITALHHLSHGGTTRVVIEVSGPVQYQDHRLSNPERIYLDIPNTQLGPSLLGKKSNVNELRVRKIRVAQPTASVTRLALETVGDCDYQVTANSKQLVIDVKPR